MPAPPPLARSAPSMALRSWPPGAGAPAGGPDRASCPRCWGSAPSTSDLHGVATAPEDERHGQVQQHDGDDRQPDGAAHGHADAGWAARRVVAVVAVDEA